MPGVTLERAPEPSGAEALLQAAAGAARCLVEHVDLEHGLALALETLRQHTGVSRVFINRYASAEQATYFWMESRANGLMPFDQAFGPGPWADDAFAEVAYPLRIGRIYCSLAAERSGLNAQHNAQLDSLSDLMVPVMLNGAYRACIGFDSADAPRVWSDAEVAVLQGTAATIAAALGRHESEAARLRAEHARALQAEADSRVLRQREILLQALTDATRSLLSGADFDAAVHEAMALLGQALGVMRVGLVQGLPAPGDAEPGRWRGTHEWTAPGVAPQMGSAAEHGVYASADWWARARAGELVGVDIPGADADCAQGQELIGTGTILPVPLFVGGRWWGIVAFDRRRGHQWQAHEIATLQAAAACISAAMERRDAEARQLLQERARADENARLVTVLSQVARASRALIDATDFESALLQWLGVCAQTQDAKRATFYDLVTHSPSGQRTVRMLCEWVRPGVASSIAVSFAQPHVIDPRGAEQTMAALTSGRVVAFYTDETASPMREFLQQQGNASVIAVPIFMDGGQWGCLSFDHGERRELQRGDVAVLETAADTLAAVLKRNEAAAALLAERERAAQMRSAALARANLALRRSTAKLAGTRDLSTFLHHVLFEAVQLFPGALAQIFVYDPADDTLAPFMGVDAAGSVRSAPGLLAGTGIAQAFPARITGAWQKLLSAGGPVWFDLHADAHFMWPGAAEFHRSMGHRGSVCTVLLAGDEPVGVLGLAEPASAPFDRADFELIQTFAQQAALAIQTERYAVEAQQAAVARERASAAEARFIELARTNESLRTSLAALSRAEDETAFLGQSVLEIARHAGADGVFLFVKAPDEARLPLRLAVRDGGSVIEDSVRPEEPALFSAGLLVASARLRRLVQEGGLVWFEIEQGAADDRMSPEVLAWHQRQGHGAAALQALMVGDRMVGMLAMTFVSVQPMQSSQSQFVHALCQPLALALELSRLSRKLQRSGEHEAVLIERQRLAREIHDGIAQSFLGIQMQLEAQGLPLPPPLEPVHALARHGLIEARRAVAALRPHALLHRSLPDAVARLLAQLTEGTRLRPIIVRPAAWKPLPLETEDHLFRIVQEALNNAVKHSAAKVLRAELSQAAGEVSILIADDGVGFDATAFSDALRGGYGLEGMQQRGRLIGACVEVLSKSREGTQVLVSLSLPDA